jgi:hypothetical protein
MTPEQKAIWRQVCRAIRLVLTPIAVVLAILYFVIDVLVLSAIRPAARWLMRWPPVALLMSWLAGLGPYPTLLLMLVPVVALEPLKPFALYLIAKRHVVVGVIVLVVTEALKVLIVERLFHLSRAKLMSIPAFARVYGFVSAWLAYLTALPPWQFVVHWTARIKALSRQLFALVRSALT